MLTDPLYQDSPLVRKDRYRSRRVGVGQFCCDAYFVVFPTIINSSIFMGRVRCMESARTKARRVRVFSGLGAPVQH
jgi:hypothetical protein